MKFQPFHTKTDGLGLEGRIGYTSASGIPARSGSTAGFATDVSYYQVGTNGTLVDIGSDFTVYNPFGTAVAGNVYILCKRIDGVWIVDAEDCS